MQAIAIAQTDFEGLFESLKAAALPGASLYGRGTRHNLTTALPRVAVAAGSFSVGAQMTVDDAAREELAFIAEHLKVGLAVKGFDGILFGDLCIVTEHFGGKEAGYATVEVLQQQDQFATERAK
jgi:hypothetical protein